MELLGQRAQRELPALRGQLADPMGCSAGRGLPGPQGLRARLRLADPMGCSVGRGLPGQRGLRGRLQLADPMGC